MVVYFGCSEATVNKEAKAEERIRLSRDWSALVGAGELEASIDLWADDAVLLPPDRPVLIGKEVIRDYVISASSIPGSKISWEPDSAHISESGDMAYLIERNVIEFDGEDGAKIVTHGKVVTVWREDSEGQWKKFVGMWNATLQPVDSSRPPTRFDRRLLAGLGHFGDSR